MNLMAWLGFGPTEIEVVLLSLKVACWATLWSLPPGIAMAYVLARYRFPGRGLLNAVVHLPLILPPVVTGYLLLLTFGPQTQIAAALANIGVVFAFRWTGAALAAAIMGFPLLVRAVRLSFEAVDPALEEAAASLGTSPLRVFFRVTLPLAMPGVVVGTVLGFAKALGEFGATITFVSSIPGETRTIPSAIYAFLQVPGGESSAYKLVLVSVLLAVLALAGSEAFARRVSARLGVKGARLW